MDIKRKPKLVDAVACMWDMPEAYDAFPQLLYSSKFSNHSEEMSKERQPGQNVVIDSKMRTEILQKNKKNWVIPKFLWIYMHVYCVIKWPIFKETQGVFNGGQKLEPVFALLHTKSWTFFSNIRMLRWKFSTKIIMRHLHSKTGIHSVVKQAAFRECREEVLVAG